MARLGSENNFFGLHKVPYRKVLLHKIDSRDSLMQSNVLKLTHPVGEASYIMVLLDWYEANCASGKRTSDRADERSHGPQKIVFRKP
jgi:hypothetical protein